MRADAARFACGMRVPPLVAHRLGRAYGPDNSRAALAGALAAGADALETDACLTADGELVLLHDSLLDVGTTGRGWAHERTCRQIGRAWLLGRDGRESGERPLVLGELLELAPPGMPLQVEVKAHADDGLARRTVEALCRRYPGERDRLEVISFHQSACAAAAAQGWRARLVAWAGYAPEALAAWSHRHGIAGVSIEHFLLTPALAAELRLAGLSVNTGTVNSAELLARTVRMAAPDAVCTDRPGELRAEAAALRGGRLAA
jgi:glycerophosphoryl diester phosphodiesterase